MLWSFLHRLIHRLEGTDLEAERAETAEKLLDQAEAQVRELRVDLNRRENENRLLNKALASYRRIHS